MRPLVTFDFHNTLATCDPWFLLEIRELPIDVLRDIDPAQGAAIDADDLRASYRALRKRVITSGREVDAVTSVAQIFAEHNIAAEPAAIAASVDRLMRESFSHVAPVPGAVEAVHAVAEAGVAVGVVSSAVYHPFLEWTLDHFGLGDTLDFVITSASCGVYKSDPDIYRHAMAAVDATPARSIHVGDSLRWDVWAAQQAGMVTVWFQTGHADHFTLDADAATPDLTVRTMVDLAPLLLDRLGDA